MNDKQRTIQQNKALHKWFELVADELNDAGLDMKKVLKPNIDISWTKSSIKEYLWRPVQYAMLGKKSTRNLSKKQIDPVWEQINRFLGEKHGIHVGFPSIENFIETYESTHKPTSLE